MYLLYISISFKKHHFFAKIGPLKFRSYLLKVSFSRPFQHMKINSSESYVFFLDRIYFSWLGPELFCLLLGPPGFNYWFSFAPVFQ